MINLSKRTKIISAVLVGFFVLWTIVPILLIAQYSFKSRILMFSDPPVFVFKPIAKNYVNLFTMTNILTHMRNSVIVALSTTALCLTLGTTSAYALSSLDMPGKNLWALMILAARMVPAGALMVPIYVIMRVLGLANTLAAIIIAHTVLNLSFAIWMMRGFFDEVPKEIEQAAMVDGCTKLQSFFRISIPLASGGLAATAILTMLYSWNEFMFALILSNNSSRTLPIGIHSFLGVSIDWGGGAAAAMVSSVPVFIAGVFIQKYLVRGLTMGAIKG